MSLKEQNKLHVSSSRILTIFIYFVWLLKIHVNVDTEDVSFLHLPYIQMEAHDSVTSPHLQEGYVRHYILEV